MIELKKSSRVVEKAVQMSKYKDATDIILYGLNNEIVARKIEMDNTLVFICDIKADKPSIKSAFETLYGVKVKKVNTLITPKGKKKAYIKLVQDGEAPNIANKIGIIG